MHFYNSLHYFAYSFSISERGFIASFNFPVTPLGRYLEHFYSNCYPLPRA